MITEKARVGPTLNELTAPFGRYGAWIGRFTRFLILLAVATGMSWLAGCSSTPKVAASRPTPHAATQPALLRYALSLQGVPYVWGGTSPVRGFDCSGYVQHVFRRYGVNLPRRSRDIAAHVPKVSRSSRRPGDLIFFQTTREPYSHVGIYLGHDAFVHASKGRGKGVQISDLRSSFWRRHWQAVGRPRIARSRPALYADSQPRED